MKILKIGSEKRWLRPHFSAQAKQLADSMKQIDLNVQNRRVLIILLGVLITLIAITVVTVFVRN